MTLRRTLVFAAVLTTSVAGAGLADAPRAPVASTEIMDTVVFYDFDSSEINEAGRRSLDEIAQWLRDNPRRILVVVGNTSEEGSQGYNRELGLERARAAKDYLVAQNIDERRLFVASRGEDLADVDTPDGAERFTLFMSDRLPDRTPELQLAEMKPSVEHDKTVPGQGPTVLVKKIANSAPVEHLKTKVGISFGIGGGVHGFIDDDTNSMTDTGGSWDARLTVGTRAHIAAEAAYFGSAQDVKGIMFQDDAMLVANGFEGNLRLNLTPDQRLQPYVFGGVGYTHYQIANQDVRAIGMESNENVLHIPAGAGLSVRGEGIVFDVRATFRTALYDDLFDDMVLEQDPADMSTWGASGRVAWEF